jgi:hypothetical protein
MVDFRDAKNIYYYQEFVKLMKGPWIASGSHIDAWAVTLPQLSRHNDPLRHAAIAIGAMSAWHARANRTKLHGASIPTNATTDNDVHYFHAVANYCESLRLQAKTPSIQSALFLSVMSLYFEMLRGNMQAALDHVNHGLAMLVTLMTDDDIKLKISALAPNPRPVIAFVGDLFSHLVPQARVIMRGNLTQEPNLPNFSKSLKNKDLTVESFMMLLIQNSHSSAISYKIPPVFKTLDEFEECWNAMRRQQIELGPLMLELIRETDIMNSQDQEEIAQFWKRLTSDPRISEFCESSTRALGDIHNAFSPLFNQIISSETESPDYLRAIHFRIQELGGYAFDDPTQYHDIEVVTAQTPRFREFLLLAEMALRVVHRDLKNPAQQVSLQCDLVWYLLLVALFCRDPLVREQATWLLKDYPRQDGLWNNQALYALALRNKFVENMNATEGTLAEQWSRLARREYIFDKGGARVIFCYLVKDEGSSEWQVIEEAAEVGNDGEKARWQRRPLTSGGKLLWGDYILT